jgi:uncharacterized membrane protein
MLVAIPFRQFVRRLSSIVPRRQRPRRRQLVAIALVAEVQQLEARTLLAAGQFTTLNPPGSTDSEANGLSGNIVVGDYFDTSNRDHAFLYNGSTYTTLNPPGSTDSSAYDVSGSNVVGFYFDASHNTHAFLYNGSTYTTLDPPGSTSSQAISVSGSTVVGDYTDASHHSHIFLYNGATYKTLDPPGSTDPEALGISGSTVLGDYSVGDPNVRHGFLYNGSTYTTLDPPGSTSTLPSNASGSNVVGVYLDASGHNHGFVYNGSTYTTLDPPGSTGSEAVGFSGSDIVGSYSDASNPSHIFLYNGSTYTTLDPPGSRFSRPSAVSGTTIVGSYDDASHNSHAFVYHISSSSSSSIDEKTIVPTAAPDLNLNQVWGGEQLTVPVTVSNLTGNITVSIYLSTTPDLTPSKPPLAASPIATGSMQFTGTSAQNQILKAKIIVAISPIAGGKYYVVAKIQSSAGVDIAATKDAVEFVGTPKSNPAAFTNGTYFKFIRDTLASPTVLAAKQHWAKVDITNAISFIKDWETGGVDLLYAYKNPAGLPAIGIGINLNSLSGTLQKMLVQDVRAYYKIHYPTVKLPTSDADVVNLLKSQASQNLKKTVITLANEQTLFNQAYSENVAAAQTVLGKTAWSKLDALGQIAIEDLVYNVGPNFAQPPNGFPTMVKALQLSTGPDLLQAAFQMVDSKRTTQSAALTLRTEGEFQNLLYNHRSLLGQIVK